MACQIAFGRTKEANLELLSGMLTVAGYQVIAARSGEHALAAVQKGSVDVALLDVVMPGRDRFLYLSADQDRS